MRDWASEQRRALFFNAAVDLAQAAEGARALHERVVVFRRILNGLRPPDAQGAGPGSVGRGDRTRPRGGGW